MECAECGGEVTHGVVSFGQIFHSSCLHGDDPRDEPPMDTPSLQDTNPEGWMYMNNRSYWGSDGY